MSDEIRCAPVTIIGSKLHHVWLGMLVALGMHVCVSCNRITIFRLRQVYNRVFSSHVLRIYTMVTGVQLCITAYRASTTSCLAIENASSIVLLFVMALATLIEKAHKNDKSSPPIVGEHSEPSVWDSWIFMLLCKTHVNWEILVCLNFVVEHKFKGFRCFVVQRHPRNKISVLSREGRARFYFWRHLSNVATYLFTALLQQFFTD